MADDEDSILKTLDSVAAPIAKFDAFPKLPSAYKSRSQERGFVTVFACLFALLLLLNDLGEFIWGWPDFEFSIDHDTTSFMDVNVDMVVNMPCQFISVDLRDAVGDRLYLSSSLSQDGTIFDVTQATALKEHSKALSASQAYAQSRKSRGFFSTLWRKTSLVLPPIYRHAPDTSACRISGSIQVKKVTANLHITTLGHGYRSVAHVDHKTINLSHVITEFSFGPYFPDITQPLDYSYEVTHENFIAYQYYLRIVPTTYIAPRSAPLRTNQYSVTHYTHQVDEERGVPGIFFKFDLDPLNLTVIQRTTSFSQLLIRCVGVIGGVFVCIGYALRVGSRALEAATSTPSSEGTIGTASGVSKLRSKWSGSSLRARANVRQSGSGWTVELPPSSPSGYNGSYTGTPLSPAFIPLPYSPVPLKSPVDGAFLPVPGAGQPGSVPPSPSFAPPRSPSPYSPSHSNSLGLPPRSPSPYTPSHSNSMGPPPRSPSPYTPSHRHSMGPPPRSPSPYVRAPSPHPTFGPPSPGPQQAAFLGPPPPRSPARSPVIAPKELD